MSEDTASPVAADDRPTGRRSYIPGATPDEHSARRLVPTYATEGTRLYRSRGGAVRRGGWVTTGSPS